MSLFTWIWRLFGRRRPSSGPVVENPRVFIASIDNNEAENPVSLDVEKEIYAPYYSSIRTFRAGSIDDILNVLNSEKYDIVHLLVRFDANGGVGTRTGKELFQAVENSGAALLIIADESPVENYIAAQANANLRFAVVLIFERNGQSFGTFFKKLFQKMANGTSMPMAWASLVPQYNGPHQANLPASLYTPNNGQLRLLGDVK